MPWGRGDLLVMYSSKSELQSSVTKVKWLKYSSVLHAKFTTQLAEQYGMCHKKSWEGKSREGGDQVAMEY